VTAGSGVGLGVCVSEGMGVTVGVRVTVGVIVNVGGNSGRTILVSSGGVTGLSTSAGRVPQPARRRNPQRANQDFKFIDHPSVIGKLYRISARGERPCSPELRGKGVKTEQGPLLPA
jgi:hypothetical protein